MTIEERAELAVETFAAGKGNCTPSVLCAWEDKIPVDHDTLMKLGAGYGATICKDLKGVETGKVLCPCAQCVRNAVLAAGEMLGE